MARLSGADARNMGFGVAGLTGVNGYLSPEGALIDTPIREKYEDEKKWRERTVNYYLSRNQRRVEVQHAYMHQSIQMYNAFTDVEDVPPYARTSDSQVARTPIAFEYINPIYNPINVRLGEFASTDYKVHSYMTNAAAKSRKEQYYTELRLQQLAQKVMPNLMQLAPELIGDASQDMAGFSGTPEQYLEERYRDMYDKMADTLLADWLDRSKFKTILDQIYRFYLLTNMAVAWVELNPHTLEVEIQPEDPRYVVWDTEMVDDHGRTMQFVTRFRYESENNILLKYPKKVTREQLQALASKESTSAYYLRPYIEERGETMYLVTETRWKYVDNVTVKKAKDGLGIPESDNDSESIRYEEVYYSIQVGSEMELEGGALPNQVRSVDFFGTGSLGVFVLKLGQSISPDSPTNLIRVQGLVRHRNALFYKLMNLIADVKGMIMMVDTSILPIVTDKDGRESPSLAALTDMIQQDKIVPVNGMQLGQQMEYVGVKPMNPMQTIEVGIPSGMDFIVNQINLISNEINSILAYSDARTGAINKYETSSNAMLNKTASDKATAYADVQFDNFVEGTLTYVANLLKIADTLSRVRAGYFNNTKLIDAIEMRLGDMTATLPRDSFILQDIGLHVRRRTNSAEMKANIQTWIANALQSGAVSSDDFLDVMTSDNIEDAAQRIRIRQREQQAMAAQQQEQQAQQQQQMMEQQMQMQMQMQQQLKEMDVENKALLEQVKADMKARNSILNAQVNAQIQETNQMQERTQE